MLLKNINILNNILCESPCFIQVTPGEHINHTKLYQGEPAAVGLPYKTIHNVSHQQSCRKTYVTWLYFVDNRCYLPTSFFICQPSKCQIDGCYNDNRLIKKEEDEDYPLSKGTMSFKSM